MKRTLDANNLYGWVTIQKQPTIGFSCEKLENSTPQRPGKLIKKIRKGIF